MNNSMEVENMKKLFKRAQMKVTDLAVRSGVILRDKRGEGFVDSAVKILISVVIGALLLAGLYALFGDVILPTLEERIIDMFDFAG